MKVSKISIMTALALGTFMALAPFSRAQDDAKDSKDATVKPARPANPNRRRGGPGGAGGFERIAERLKLTDDQKTKLQPVFQDEAKQLRELRQDTALTVEQRREKMKEIRTQTLAKAKPTLSTEQYDQLKKIQEQGPGRGPRGGNRQGGGAGGGAGGSAGGSTATTDKKPE